MRPPDHVLNEPARTVPRVYAWFRDGLCLYVGSTKQPLSARLQGHHVIRMTVGDELLVWDTTREDLEALEQTAINDLRPRLNVCRKAGRGEPIAKQLRLFQNR